MQIMPLLKKPLEPQGGREPARGEELAAFDHHRDHPRAPPRAPRARSAAQLHSGAWAERSENDRHWQVFNNDKT
jgi:hypothetical protein